MKISNSIIDFFILSILIGIFVLSYILISRDTVGELEYQCYSEQNFGVFLEYKGIYQGYISIRMTDDEYELYCLGEE